ncbi:adenine phosphoribosyltransferase [Parapedobacter soli]|uniref:adenine phosphoribosyltransferase n=1 Tax=Parapedobacter soli TaxID=416955 RepID=UPI0021CA8537|nr:adenine phosphoribosyltransferase [Parapedobacter soli]
MIEQRLKSAVRDVLDFPKPGIVFKDITPILKDPQLCEAVVECMAEPLDANTIDMVAGIESRGFLFGPMLAQRLGKPFVPIRKAGKLPYTTVREEYALEYGCATIEIHSDAFAPGSRVLVHDDLLATGGTVAATSRLIRRLGGSVAGYTFIISLDFLNGRACLADFSPIIHSLIGYD